MSSTRTAVRELVASLARAHRAFDAGRLDEAREAIALVLACDPTNPSALDLRERLSGVLPAAAAAQPPTGPHRTPPGATGGWAQFEARVRTRRAARCAERLKAARAAGDAVAAEGAWLELKQLQPGHPLAAAPPLAAAEADRFEAPLAADSAEAEPVPAASDIPEDLPLGDVRLVPTGEDAGVAALHDPVDVSPGLQPGSASDAAAAFDVDIAVVPHIAAVPRIDAMPAAVETARVLRPRAPARRGLVSPARTVGAIAAGLLLVASAAAGWRWFAASPAQPEATAQIAAPAPEAVRPAAPVAAAPEPAASEEPESGVPIESTTDTPAAGTSGNNVDDAAAAADAASAGSLVTTPAATTTAAPDTARAEAGEPNRVADGAGLAPPPAHTTEAPPSAPTTAAPQPRETPAPLSDVAQVATATPDVRPRGTAAPPLQLAPAPPLEMARAVTAPPPSSLPAARVEPAPDPGAAVRSVIDAYRLAYNRLDAPAARRVWPAVDEPALRRAFGQLRSQTITFDRCQMRTEPNTASAVCEGQAQWVPDVGDHSPRNERRTWRFELARAPAGDDWRIMQVRVGR